MEAKDFIAALVQSGLTQSQIAERTGIPQPTLSKVLRGDVSDVLSRNYRKLQSLHDEVCPKPTPAPVPAGEHAACGDTTLLTVAGALVRVDDELPPAADLGERRSPERANARRETDKPRA
jgi:transcriptional regulator with XRE-family HTH domain